jgi:hypothetical protein
MKLTSKPHILVKDLIYEEISISLPKFFKTLKPLIKFGGLKAESFIAVNKKNANQFAFRLSLKTPKPRTSGKRTERISLRFSVVAILDLEENQLSAKDRVRYVVEQAPKQIYEIIKQTSMPFLSHSLIQGFKFPKLPFKL